MPSKSRLRVVTSISDVNERSSFRIQSLGFHYQGQWPRTEHKLYDYGQGLMLMYTTLRDEVI